MPLSVAGAAHGVVPVTVSFTTPREDLVPVIQYICLEVINFCNLLALLFFCHHVFRWNTLAHDLYELIQMVL